MIVEDDTALARELASSLEKWQYNVVLAERFDNILQEFIEKDHIWSCWTLISQVMMDFIGVVSYVKFQMYQLSILAAIALIKTKLWR